MGTGSVSAAPAPAFFRSLFGRHGLGRAAAALFAGPAFMLPAILLVFLAGRRALEAVDIAKDALGLAAGVLLIGLVIVSVHNGFLLGKNEGPIHSM